MNISQSLLKSYMEYLNYDECGVWIKAKYIDQLDIAERAPTEAMQAGQWFEYICTGATPRNSGRPPEPVRLKNGELNAMYRTLEAHLPVWEMIRPERAVYGRVISNDTEIFGHTLTGITDVKTPDLIGDIKTSAHIDNKWEEYGWGGDADHLANKALMVQAKFYLLIEWLNTRKVLPFYFYVFSSNSNKAKVIKVNMTEESIRSWLADVRWMIDSLEDDDFSPIPSFERCGACPLIGCKHKRVVPDEIEVKL